MSENPTRRHDDDQQQAPEAQQQAQDGRERPQDTQGSADDQQQAQGGPQQPQDDDQDRQDPPGDPQVAKLRREAARHRTEARDARTEVDTLRARVQALQDAELKRQLDGHGITFDAFTAAGARDRVLTEDGTIDATALTREAEAVAARFGTTAPRRIADPNTGRETPPVGGAGTTWADKLRGSR